MYDHPTPPPTPPSTPGGTSKVHAFIPQIRPRVQKLTSPTATKAPFVIRRPTDSLSSTNATPPLPHPSPKPIQRPKPSVIPNLKRKSTGDEKKQPETTTSTTITSPPPPKKQRRDSNAILPRLDESEKPQVRTMKQVMHSTGGKPMEKQSTEVILSQNVDRPIRIESITSSASSNSGGAMVPQVRIVDGQVVLDESSLVIPNMDEEDKTVDYSRIQENTTRTTNPYRRRNTASDKWTKKETEKFYNALRQYGTDFTILGLLFPDRSRRQIRNKFKKEEKQHPKKVDEALTNRIPIDGKKYQTLLSKAKDKASAEAAQRAAAQPPAATDDGTTTTTTEANAAEGSAGEGEGAAQQPTQQGGTTDNTDTTANAVALKAVLEEAEEMEDAHNKSVEEEEDEEEEEEDEDVDEEGVKESILDEHMTGFY